MSQETGDLLFGVAVLVPALLLIFAAGWVLQRFTRAAFHRALAPLAPTIDGTLSNEGNGALAGTHDGRTLWVRTSKDVRSLEFPSTGGDGKRNLFEIDLPDTLGATSWTISSPVSIRGVEWRITSDDAALVERLRAAGALAAIVAMNGWLLARYTRGTGLLTLTEDITPALAPTPERFAAQLALLSELHRINAAVNATDRRATTSSA